MTAARERRSPSGGFKAMRVRRHSAPGKQIQHRRMSVLQFVFPTALSVRYRTINVAAMKYFSAKARIFSPSANALKLL
jgi:hypothetical protein